MVVEELEYEKQLAEIYLFSMNEHFPELIRSIQNRKAAYSIMVL